MVSGVQLIGHTLMRLELLVDSLDTICMVRYWTDQVMLEGRSYVYLVASRSYVELFAQRRESLGTRLFT